MADYKVKDPTTGEVIPFPWTGIKPPTTADIDYFLSERNKPADKGMFGKVRDIVSSPTAQRFMFGPNQAEQEKMGVKIAGQSKGILPSLEHEPDDSNLKWAGKSLYNMFVQPLGSAEGLMGTANPGKLNVKPPPVAAPVPKPRLALPPAPKGTPRFIAGAEGVVENGPDAFLTANYGPNPGAGRPVNSGSLSPTVPPKVSAPQISQTTNTWPVNQPKVVDPLIPTSSQTPRPQTPVQPRPQARPGKIASGQGTPAKQNADLVPIGDVDTKSGVRHWANRLSGAKQRGINKGKEFEDLADESLVSKYESGSREGRLAEVESYFNKRYDDSVAAGFLKEGQKRPNYLRHYFEQNPEEVTAAVKTYVAKNPQFAKEGKFPTYDAAKSSGLTPKYKGINEIAGKYEEEYHRGLANRELYDWLQRRGSLDSGDILKSPDNWTFKGKDAEQLKQLVGNVLGNKSPKWLGKTGEAFSFAKNIYLAGGIPGTKYNMHAWNTALRNYKLQGVGKAVKNFFTDATGKNAQKTFERYRNVLPELIDNGYQYHAIDDMTKDLNILPGKLGKVQEVFERPLFERALPAMKLEATVNVLNKLEAAGMKRAEALKKAAEIGNNFYGGMDKSLRSGTSKDLARVVFLAPDWLESSVRLALKDWSGLARVLLGKGDAADKIYAASKVRGSIVSGGTIGLAAYGGKKGKELLNDRSGDALTIPLGEDSKDKKVKLATVRTADEADRVPVEVAIKAYQGDPMGLVELLVKNKLSTPLKAGLNIVQGQDDFGNPIRGEDKFRRKITMGQSILKHLNELSRPAQHQFIQGAFKYISGEGSLLEGVSTGLELPLRFSKKPVERGGKGLRLPRLTMPSD